MGAVAVEVKGCPSVADDTTEPDSVNEIVGLPAGVAFTEADPTVTTTPVTRTDEITTWNIRFIGRLSQLNTAKV